MSKEIILKEVIKPKENHIIFKNKPHILEGGTFVDDRGVLKFVNQFDFYGVKRFYNVTNISSRMIRAWHGHEIEGKLFLVVSGTFLVGTVNMETEELNKYILSDHGNPRMLWVPPGYANGFMNLTEKNNLMIFSTASMEETKNDDIRFPYDKWNIWEEDYR